MNATAARALARGRPRVAVELTILGVALLAGLLGMPLLLWAAGRVVIGPYVHGGADALLSDFFRGLATGSPACWLLVAGPYALALYARACWRILRGR